MIVYANMLLGAQKNMYKYFKFLKPCPRCTFDCNQFDL